ncbi:Protein translocase subunit secA [Anopheles sinensis]|uniref:Protein translocase subunit secA n=1 Tax=Anopheles sinensis TaxID=74873 RepID=A0A084VIP4_ANOSI|nr:Protein translocase subunit secA [Anopheles sinensis]
MHHKRKNVTLKRVEKLVIEKYRIATVEQVASVFPNDGAECNHYDLSLLTAEEATSFLIEDLIGDNLISHDQLGRLDQYLFVNSHQERNSMAVYCREELPKNLSILGRALELYISEAGKSFNAPDCIKPYFEEYSGHFQYQKWAVSYTFDYFLSRLSMPENANFLSFVEERNSRREGTRNDIADAKYFHLMAQYKFIANWLKCCNDEEVRNQLCDYIQTTGVESQALPGIVGFDLRR